MTAVALRGSGFRAPAFPLQRGADSSNDNSGSWSDVDQAIALPSDPDPNPAGHGPGSAALVQRGAPEALLHPAHGRHSAGDDGEKEQEEDGWEAALDEEHAPLQGAASRLKRPCDGGLVSKGKRPRIRECGGDGGGSHDEAALPGPIALGRRSAPGGREETAALGSHHATPEQARTSEFCMAVD